MICDLDQGVFNCTNGVEVEVEVLCNGTDDCGDNSDEENELCRSEFMS